MQLNVFVKRKRLEEIKNGMNMEGKIPDKRKFKIEMTLEESLEKSIISEIEAFGIPNPTSMLSVIKKIPHWKTLNITLLLLVYFYFDSKNRDFGIVLQNLDKDFEEEVNKIYERGLFPRLDGRKFTPLEKYKFRQDFMIYMILLNEYQLTKTVEIEFPSGIQDGLSRDGSVTYDEPFDGFDPIGN